MVRTPPLRAYVRPAGTDRREWRELRRAEQPLPPEPFTTCYTHEAGDIWIEWRWCSRGRDTWVPVAVRAVVQPTVFAEVVEVQAEYVQALRAVAELLERDVRELDAPERLPAMVVSPQ